MARFYPVAVEIEGRRYAGDWTLKQGAMLCVGSAYGSKTVALGRAKPENVAAKTLREIVIKWHADREREAKRLKRPTRR